MVYGGHFCLVWNTEIHALCGRGHCTLDRKQPIYGLAESVRGEGRSQDYWYDRTDDRSSPDFRIGDPDRICWGRGYGLRYVPLNCVVLFQHAWGASGILVAVTCGRHFGNCSTGYNRSFRDSYAPTADRTSDRGGRQRVANVVLGQVASGLASPGRPKASPLYS